MLGMPPRKPKQQQKQRRPVDRSWWLRRADQSAVAGLTCLALVAMTGYWWSQGGWRGRLIEIDDAAPLTARFEVDINAAAWPEIAQLPDIGETLARRIVDSRDQEGPFVDHQDLRRVPGIGPVTLEKMRPYLRPMPDAGATAGR
jgi:competence protein ComEA